MFIYSCGPIPHLGAIRIGDDDGDNGWCAIYRLDNVLYFSNNLFVEVCEIFTVLRIQHGVMLPLKIKAKS